MGTIQIKRGTKSALTSNNPSLLAGQPCFETDTGQMKVGNGTNKWNDLPYVGSDGSGSSIFYGQSATAASTASKVVTIDKFKLVTGVIVIIEFTITNTASNPTLNISGTGAKPIYYNGSTVSASFIQANGIYMFRYNGSQYDIIGDTNPKQSSDTKVTNTLNKTVKAYITGTTSATTNTGAQVFDTGVYLDSVEGRLGVKSLLLGNAILTYDNNTNSIKISFV